LHNDATKRFEHRMPLVDHIIFYFGIFRIILRLNQMHVLQFIQLRSHRIATYP